MKILRFFLILLAGLGFNNIHASKSGNQVITPEYIQKIHLQDPARALHLLDSAEQHHLPGIRPFETDILRTMCYEVTGECILEEKYARRALASDSVQLVPSRKIRMLVALMRALVEQGKNEDAIRCGEEAIGLARLLHDEGREGETLRNIGNIYRNMNRPGEALKLYRPHIPVVWNTHGYETEETLTFIAPYADIFLTDVKYFTPETAKRYCGKADYFAYASRAAEIMCEKPLIFQDGMMQSGTIVRHLVLPQNVEDSLRILDWFAPLKDKAYLSLMSQYTPFGKIDAFPELQRKITKREYHKVLDHALSLGIENIFVQELKSSGGEYIPAWDY